MLPREMWAKRGRTITVRFGPPVRPEELATLPDASARTQALRTRVDGLSTVPGRSTSPSTATRPSSAIAARDRTDEINSEIAALKPRVLLESGSYQVICAGASELPAVLRDIGRLRELTFRHAGEGTGRPRDLDRFDETYQHLFVWDRARHEIAGAYRLGATDLVSPGGRVEGLYTRTLFDYDARLIDEIGPALELGRAFVPPSYQRDFSPLLLLWKGIARIVARSGRYRRLFGVVSISERYTTTSRQLLVKFLQTRRFDADLGRLVRANDPPPPPHDEVALSTVAASVDDVSSLIKRIEPDGKDMPVLLRQYLKLNAKLLGFTVDKAFGNVLDGLVLVDLADIEPAVLSRFMGRAEAEAFRRTIRR
jgi:putative hemolysin